LAIGNAAMLLYEFGASQAGDGSAVERACYSRKIATQNDDLSYLCRKHPIQDRGRILVVI
jgi:hypothetical protein